MELARLYLIKNDLVITHVPPKRSNPSSEMLSGIAAQQMSSNVESILEVSIIWKSKFAVLTSGKILPFLPTTLNFTFILYSYISATSFSNESLSRKEANQGTKRVDTNRTSEGGWEGISCFKCIYFSYDISMILFISFVFFFRHQSRYQGFSQLFFFFLRGLTVRDTRLSVVWGFVTPLLHMVYNMAT